MNRTARHAPFLSLFLLLLPLALLPAVPDPAAAAAGDNGSARDVGQYFDRFTQEPGPENFHDNSSHPLRGLTTTDNSLLFGAVDCLECHYDSGKGGRRSDECLKCHFEYQPNAPAPNHGNGKLELAEPDGNALPKRQAAVANLAEYDAWCLSCHKGGSTTTLGNVAARGKTIVNDNNFARSRHRSLPARRGGAIGCIDCHAPHGSGNVRLVRELPSNRHAAPRVPALFGVFPNDNLGKGGYGEARPIPYRSRTDRNVADADDDFGYCNAACHRAKKDHVIVRDNTTGNYILTKEARIVHAIGDETYTIDTLSDLPFFHVHVSKGIIPTDNMVDRFAKEAGITGPGYYHYPGREGSAPSSFGAAQNATSPLPFFPDYRDGDRDFPNGYLDQGPIRYRFSCSTCHDPHGSPLPNSDPGASGYPDLRMTWKAPNDLCRQCHF
jgi:hypothetical protein